MKKLFFITISLLSLASCRKDPAIEQEKNYYPTHISQLKYEVKGFKSSYPQSIEAIENPDWVSEYLMIDTISWTYNKDTLISGKSHSMYSSPNNYTSGYLIRKENDLFYKTDFYFTYLNVPVLENESLFLKGNLKTGDTWTDVTANITDNYTVIFKKLELTLNSKVFKNVIGIKKVTHRPNDSSEDGLTSIYYYAENIGEIYSYEPYPLSGRYQDVKKYYIE